MGGGCGAPGPALRRALTQRPALSRPDGAIDPWLHALWEKVLALYPVPPGLGEIPPGVP